MDADSVYATHTPVEGFVHAEDILVAQDVSVAFPGVMALNKVSLSVRRGEVLGLMGENGAGKSTLLKVLSGVNKPHSGKLWLDGKPCHFADEKQALDAGIAIIYQELHLVPELTVAENLMLGHWPTKRGLVDSTHLVHQAMQVLQQLGETFRPQTKVKDLSIGQRQMVEIGKALIRNASVIAFDEPTSSLSGKETDRLMDIIRALRQQGCGIVYVTHRMEEVFRICDRVAVLRDSAHVQTFEQVTPDLQPAIVRAMVGRSIQDLYAYRPRPWGPALLSVDRLLGPGLTEPVSLTLHQGEILGIFGLIGAGRTELLRLIYGAERTRSGHVTLGAKVLTQLNPVQATRQGLGFCPEDRKAQGIVPDASVSDNVNISCRDKTAWKKWFRRPARELRLACECIQQWSIKTSGAQAKIVNLSGGNQQKVILARWMASDKQVLLMDEPTRGIDVGAKREIYEWMYRMGESGKGLVVVSSDLAEIMGVADRILVINNGRLVGGLTKQEATPEKLMQMALPNA